MRRETLSGDVSGPAWFKSSYSSSSEGDSCVEIATETATSSGSIQVHSGGEKPSPCMKNRSKITMKAAEAVVRPENGGDGRRRWPEAIALQAGPC